MASYDGGTSWGGGLDWDMTSNQGLTPLVNYNFTLQVEGIYNLPCKSVHVFHRENEYETLQEGGLNDYVHMLRKPISKPMTFQVERYVGIDMLDPLALGTELILPVLLQVSRYTGNGEVLDLADSMQRVYTFTGCTVIAKDFGELSAERSGLLVETTTIAYREMICVDNPSTKSKRKAWSMKKDHANMERDAELKNNKRANYGINELTKQELEERAHMYVDKNVKDIPEHVYNYKGKKVQKVKVSDDRGIATTNEMAPISEREKAAKRFFMPGGKSLSGYKGRSGKSAIVNKDELSREEMEKRARKGGADIPTMKAVEPRKGGAKIPEMKAASGQRRYFIEGSKSKKDYTGKVERSAAVSKDEKRKSELEAAARKGGAKIPEMKATSGQRRYFIEGSKSKKDYTGKIERSASVRQDEKSKAELEKNARMYFPKESKGHKDYKGTRTYSAALLADEKRKSELEEAARKGGADIREMKPARGQRRYFMEGSKSRKDYTGKVERSAALPPDEKRKKEFEEAARKGGADIREMKPARGQRRYFMEGSKSRKDYTGKVERSAALPPDEKSKKELEAAARKGGADIKKMKPVKPRKGGAEKKQMAPAKNQRRYFINGSASLKSYSGTVKASAITNQNELRKPAMQAKARQWPKTRSAVDVAAFLKNKR